MDRRRIPSVPAPTATPSPSTTTSRSPIGNSPYFAAVQYFGNLGFFHATELIGTSVRPQAPVSLRNTQWSRALPYHDVLNALPQEATQNQSSAVLTTEVETFWRQRTLAEFGPDTVEGFSLAADGQLTRGDYLNALLKHLQKN